MNVVANVGRVIRFASQNVVRNIWLTVMTVTILILALCSVTIVVGVSGVSQQLLTSVKDKVDISVSLREDATEEQGRALADQLRMLSEVRSVQFVTSEEALEQFKAEHKDDPNINVQETLDLLEQNPLRARIVVSARSIESYASIISYLGNDQNTEIVETDRSNLDQAELVIDKLTALSDKISKVALGVTVLFIVISFLVVFNTIRIAIYTHKEEIGIMKLVGATNWFVRLPFLAEGIIYALLATVITIAIIAPILTVLGPQINNTFFADYGVNINQFFSDHFWTLVIFQFIGTSLLNMASAAFAMSRYLRV